MFDIEEELRKLPVTPGVYMHKDSLGEVIYVGKAVNLRNRVRQYFRKPAQQDPKVRAMVSNIAEFDHINCATEMEALILECNLIKKYMPRYNVLLKDDKTYPYIAITTGEEFPRVIRTRLLKRDGSRYFGPYSDSGAVRQIISMIDEMYPLKKCAAKSFAPGVRPCLNYHIGKCPGICIGKADRDEYMSMIDEISDVLGGSDSRLIAELERKMNAASEDLRYEDAAKYRDYIRAVRHLGETQRASVIHDRDIDILMPVCTDKNSIIAQYRVRDGKLNGREIIYVRDDVYRSAGAETGAEEMLSCFIKQHYTETAKLPREILLPMHVEDEELLEGLLNSINDQNAAAGSDIAHHTKISVPARGEKRAMLRLAESDSLELVRSIDERAEREQERRDGLRERISRVITEAARADGSIPCLIPEGDDREYRVEAYDISNLNGLDTVGAMVVYEGRTAIRSDYRKFKVRTAEGDDYGSLQEVLYRRLKRARNGDEGFSRYPDIMFIDGGLGQVHAVKKVTDAFGISIPVVGLAKDDSHRTRAIVFSDGHEFDLKEDRLLFAYAGTIQEEVHRFAITYMSGVRGKKMTHSVLEDIPGIGPRRRAALLTHFGTIDAIRKASYEDLLTVNGMNSAAAESVASYFAGEPKEHEDS